MGKRHRTTLHLRTPSPLYACFLVVGHPQISNLVCKPDNLSLREEGNWFGFIALSKDNKEVRVHALVARNRHRHALICLIRFCRRVYFHGIAPPLSRRCSRWRNK